MSIKIGINGFGRIGRNVLRGILESKRSDVEVIAVNDLAPVATIAHLLKFDSVHGKLPLDVSVDGNSIVVGGTRVRVSSEREPAKLGWADVDIALECTGLFKSRQAASDHLKNGSSKVLISAPAADADRIVVYGVNHDTISPDDKIVSNASCTTNCLSPVAKVINDSIGIKRGFMTTIHAYTGSQLTLDAVASDMYRARAAAVSMIPTTTGAARAVGLVLPELAGKLDGMAIRIPLPNVSVVDLKFESSRETSIEEINSCIVTASDGPMKGVLGYTDLPNVSIDFNHDSRSSIFHLDQTRVIDGTFCRILTWYDNEWGYSNRMADVAAVMG